MLVKKVAETAFAEAWGQVLAKKVDRSKPWVQTGIHLAAFVVFALAVTYMVKGTYNPFIYFTF